MKHTCYSIDCNNNPLYTDKCDINCYEKYINGELILELNTVCKDLYFTYLLHRYLNIRKMPTVLNNHILSFLDYGGKLHTYVTEYLRRYYMQCVDNKYLKKRIREIMGRTSFRYPKHVRRVRLYTENISKCIESCVKRIMNIIPDIEILENSSIFNIINPDNNFKYLDKLIKQNYNSRTREILYKAVINYDNNLLLKIPHYNLMLNIKYPLALCKDVWAVIIMLHVVRPGIVLDKWYNQLFAAGSITIIKYALKHFWKITLIPHVLYLISFYGYVELLDVMEYVEYDVYNIFTALTRNHYNVFIWYYMKYGITQNHAVDILEKLSISGNIDALIFINTIILTLFGVNGLLMYNLIHTHDGYYTDDEIPELIRRDSDSDYGRDNNFINLLEIDIRDDISYDSQFDSNGDPHGYMEGIIEEFNDCQYISLGKELILDKFYESLYDEMYEDFYDDYIEDFDTLYIKRKYAHLID